MFCVLSFNQMHKLSSFNLKARPEQPTIPSSWGILDCLSQSPSCATLGLVKKHLQQHGLKAASVWRSIRKTFKKKMFASWRLARVCNDAPDACGLHRTHRAYSFVHLSSLVPQPVSLSDREVISRLRNCLLALAAHKVLLYDTSVLYCYESSLQHQVRITPVKTSLWN